MGHLACASALVAMAPADSPSRWLFQEAAPEHTAICHTWPYSNEGAGGYCSNAASFWIRIACQNLTTDVISFVNGNVSRSFYVDSQAWCGYNKRRLSYYMQHGH